MSDSSSPVVEDAERERLMDALEDAAKGYGELCVGDPTEPSARKEILAARDALRSYVSADTRRLDWLDSQYYAPRDKPWFHQWSLAAREGTPLREAIDSAMRESPQ